MSVVHELVPGETLVHELVELHASAAPQAVAVRFRDQRLSYGQLNTRANQLARYLAARGVGPEQRVVVCLEPGLDVVVALLALLKLGAVYVPLDSSYPPARIEVMLSDTLPCFVLTHGSLRESLPFARWNTLALDELAVELATFEPGNLGIGVAPDRTAYVYYTSGTTGTPKGVMASHANLASYIGSARRRYGFRSTDVGLSIARFSFSISMFELLSPLAAGGTLVVLERAHILDFARMSQTLREATFFHAGPSLLRGLLAYLSRHGPDFSAFAGVRHASSGGDMVPVEVLDGLRQVFPNAEVFVIYGCSEISCMGTTYQVPRGVTLTRSYVGAAFEGTTVRVLDEELRDVPPGAVGEVFFAGPGVVKGYLNRPELTAERFIELDGRRFYRTGDLGRSSEDGLLELVGRSDFQIKLRGMRIELGEVEHYLRRAPGVADAVVSAKDVAGEKALVAYVVVGEGAPGDGASRAAAIRGYLTQQLPEYMVPSVYVELAALPLNHNLKLDRRALPDPPLEATRVAGSAGRAPQTATEQRLAALWRALLRVDDVRLDDHFFELGGSSSLALQLLLEIDRELGVTLTGLEVLRESLELQATLCEQRAGSPGPASASVGASASPEAIQAFYFGPADSLYGVLHGPTGAEHAALICGPLGHEALRAHFVLKRLARRLAALGIPALCFHYYGCGDSWGNGDDATCARWQRDIRDAYQELKRRTGAKHVTALGARLGGTLLSRAAEELPLARLVLWDPIPQGAEYRAQLVAAERRYAHGRLPAFRARIASWLSRSQRELLGHRYSEQALRELARLELARPTPNACPARVFTSQCDWLDLARLEDMLPDVGISEALLEMIAELR